MSHVWFLGRRHCNNKYLMMQKILSILIVAASATGTFAFVSPVQQRPFAVTAQPKAGQLFAGVTGE